MSEEILFTPTERGQKATLTSRILWPVMIALSVLAVVELVVQLAVMPRMVLRRVEIIGDVGIAEQELLAIAGLSGREYYLSVDPAEVRRRLEAYPLVRQASVEKVFPDTLRLTVTGRVPLAVALAEVDGRTVAAAFDEDGVVFRIGASAAAVDAPVVSGLSFTPALGISLPTLLRPLLRDLADLKRKAPELYRVVSEIRVSAINAVKYELDFFPAGHRVRVRLDDRFDEITLRYAFLAIDVLSRARGAADLKEIDLRGGGIVYLLRDSR